MMQNVYFGCAAVGGSLLVLQTLMMLLGIGGGHDADVGPDDMHVDHVDHPGHGHDSDAFVKVLTFKSIVAFVTFFGLCGMSSEAKHLDATTTLVLSTLAGTLALYAVTWMMRALSRLQSRGNLRLENAVGLIAKVYLRIPPRMEGAGKVTVAVQGRSVELKAVTSGAEIPTGSPVKVVATRDADTLEVQPLVDAVP
jgi:membrane protein implicated in regulation of membrane protease activity